MSGADGNRRAPGVDAADTRGFTPLIRAARRGDLEAIDRLLQSGADPDRGRTGADGWPPLMHALHVERRAAVRLLLERGADPGAAGQGGLTPLMMAASDGDVEMVRLLLDHGADPDARLFLGFTAVDYAVAYGHASVVRLLRSASGARAGARGGGARDPDGLDPVARDARAPGVDAGDGELRNGPGRGDERPGDGERSRGPRVRFAGRVTLWLAWAAGSPELVSLLQS